MLDRPAAEALFLQHLAWIERVCASLCRRHGIAGDDADELASWARASLIDDDYAIVRKFRGESAFTTYLTVVLSTLFSAWRVREHGRWRPSAAARRAGAVATRLETLVYRDRLSLGHAAEQLRTSGETTLSDRELASVLARLPRREPIRPTDAGDEPLKAMASTLPADEIVKREGVASDWERARAALRLALDELPDEDRLVVRLRFWEQLSVADIARALNVPQKPLYRRLEHALVVLRRKLEAAGVCAELARSLTSEGVGGGSAEHVSLYRTGESENPNRERCGERTTD